MLNDILNRRNYFIKKNVLSVYWLGGAGFILKYEKYTLGIDLYLSDKCRGKDDCFKRLIPAPLLAKDLCLDYLICTHDHGDHFDAGSIHDFMNNDKTKLIGPVSVYNAALKLGIEEKKIIVLNRDEKKDFEFFNIEAVMADHGTLSEDAIGVIINIGCKKVYFTGDTCCNAGLCEKVLQKGQIDLLLLPINGKYGNMGVSEAAQMVLYLKPKMAVPCHYWLFKEHGGDPGEFVEYCSKVKCNTDEKVLAIAEELNLG